MTFTILHRFFCLDYLQMTSILLANKNLDVKSELEKVSEWLLANRLSLNVSKSNFLLISSRKTDRNIKVNINRAEN